MAGTILLWGRRERYENYQAAVTAAGGKLLCSQDPMQADACDALLLPGGGDIEAWRYGQRDWACRDTGPGRDAAELALLERFVRNGRPVLGICRGLQVINVFFGGTLQQDLPGHSAVGGADRLHTVETAPGTIGALWGEDPVVNSAHHQAVDRLGEGLEAVQWAADGTVEALCHRDLPVWAVQWHPERLRGIRALAGAADGDLLFRAFLALRPVRRLPVKKWREKGDDT